MRILIYGAGALGQALGCMMAADGHRVDLVLRERFIKSIQQHGLRVTGIFGNRIARADNIGLFSRASDSTGTYDATFITTKSYDTEFALQELLLLAQRAGDIISMQNGCGNVEKVEKVFGPERSLGARVITGFEIVKPGQVNITVSADAIHIGNSRKGAPGSMAVQLADAIEHAGHPCSAVEDIHQSLFAKLLYNCALNPLGAVLGVHYGALAENEGTKKIIDSIIEETFAVISALGGTTPWENAEEYKVELYDRLLPATFNHRPSMLQDLENGKQTEINALTGFVSDQGKKMDIPAPTCDMLTSLVRFKELLPR
ncbi:ketopantoate reductase family protein [Desulfomarina sp.]